MSNRTQNKVVIITGGAQGIGFGCAEMLAREGAKVVIADINAEKGEAAAAAIRAQGGEAIFRRVDVLKESDCAALADFAYQHYGQLHGLINNVGYYARVSLEQTTTELWDLYLNLNLRSAFYCCKFAIPYMQKSGSGSIINIGSIHGIQPASNIVAYGIAKGGLLSLTRSLAGTYAADRIRANYVIPGWVLSESEIALHESLGLPEAELRAKGPSLPLGRHQTPQDTGHTAVFLISDESSQITGTIFHIDAGATTLPLR